MARRRDPFKDDTPENPAARFLRAARLCRTRDLEQLVILGELVKGLSKLIHALQKERGASSIFLGSNGLQFAKRLAAHIAECLQLEQLMRERLQRVDQKLDRMSSGARFYTRIALAFRALDTLTGTRQQIASLNLAPQDSVKAFTEIIGSLLAVGFEIADIAADSAISRALVALVNFSQGKEYAGQERATAGAAFSRGTFQAAEQRRLRELVAAQIGAFRIFAEFAEPAHLAAFQHVYASRDSQQVERMRKRTFDGEHPSELAGITADGWFEHTTGRIDAMRAIEDQMAADLERLCAIELAEARNNSLDDGKRGLDGMAAAVPVAMLVTEVDPARTKPGLDGGVGVYALEGALPKPMRSILDVIQAQCRHIDEVNQQLEAARTALTERKVIERAKGLLMVSRRLSEKDAYALMRETAMNQNKRVFEIAESIMSMAEILKA
jgi:AmiR/NasT family two-component response regulator